MADELKLSLKNFVDWVEEHLTGDEKGEAQIYLDRLFQAFGLGGVREAGGTLEERVKKRGKRGLTTGYADYVWKPVVLIEMKKRGENLRKHQPQAFDYWVHLTPNRPRWVVLCNFDEFWIYDFDTQIDEPVDQLKLEDLPDRYGPLNFLRPSSPPPKFRYDLEAVTRGAADELVGLFNDLVARGIEREIVQRFALQCLVALFAEDIGLLEKYFFADLLDECTTPASSYDLIGGLFTEMNTPGQTRGGRFKGVPYFNGGLFADPVRIELELSEIAHLKEAAKYRWELVRPEIFGTIFEHSMGKETRHALGAHFTSAADIMKIVGPTIVAPWRDAIEGAKTQRELRGLRERLQRLKILDPACGSGNFLYVAYRELKRLEALILERTKELSKKVDRGQIQMGFVTAGQFYGIDIDPFAVELAKVTMMIARKLAIDELDLPEAALPLDNLDQNFLAADALLEGEAPRTWPEADVIIGNPPFLGAKRLLEERGGEYLERLRSAYPDLSGMVDYCVYWFGKAHQALPFYSNEDPFTGRAGLVGTQNIRFGDSCVHSLSSIEEKGGVFIEAVDNHPWSGEANVNVSIVNWVKPDDEANLPANRRLWSYTDDELEVKEVKIIPPDLSTTFDIRSAEVLACNRDPKVCFQGVTPGTTDFFLTEDEVEAIDRDSVAVLRPFLGANEMVSGRGAHRIIMDFTGLSLLAARSHSWAFGLAEDRIYPLMVERAEEARQKGKQSEIRAREGHLEQWWLFWRPRPELLCATRPLRRCIASPRHGRYHVLMFVNPEILLGDALQLFAFEDDYSFGILQSSAHESWWKKSSRLKNEADIRYTENVIFAKFPWPQNPSEKNVLAVVKATRELHQQRENALEELGGSGGLRAVYSALQTPGRHPLKDAHKELNKAVLRAYGFDQRRDTLEQLLELNHSVFELLQNGEEVTAPGIPSNFPEPDSLVESARLEPPEIGAS